ncbi:hypothetical protein [Terriglobus sp.]|uniref:hypothetical protein n=1 Tax=Terriglobus sp. TaxID=1889013 RepID=UPI003B0064AD
MTKAGSIRSLATVCLLGCFSGVMRADTTAATLTVDKTTEVPGGVLKPGVYTIGIVDSLKDRMVVHIDGDSGKTHLLFLGVPKPPMGVAGTHPVEWNASGSSKHALRGYNFGDQFVEFVYPKKEAVALANSNDAGVVAIDPASEGRPELTKLTSQDREMVGLWMLTPVEVGPHQKGISAQHYTAAAPVVATGNTTSITSTNTASSSTRIPVAPANTNTSSPAQMSRLHVPPAVKAYRPTIKRLPQTGSEMPIIWLLGSSSLLGALALRARRSFTA